MSPVRLFFSKLKTQAASSKDGEEASARSASKQIDERVRDCSSVSNCLLLKPLLFGEKNGN